MGPQLFYRIQIIIWPTVTKCGRRGSGVRDGGGVGYNAIFEIIE